MGKQDDKPTKQQAKLLDEVKKEGVVCVKRDADGSGFFLPSGKSVAAGMVSRCIRKGYLIPNDDGLFPGVTQTYRLSEAVA